MVTLIIPYYRAPNMLRKQLETISGYTSGIQVVVVDDGSPEPAADMFKKLPSKLYQTIQGKVELYRIIPDIPWNREQARNLGAYVARSEWIIQVDIDHVLPILPCIQLLQALEQRQISADRWYRFPRKRVGAADDTRQKDKIAEKAASGWIHPHMDSYLITREQFLKSPYDERYSGCLGGGTPFNERMSKLFGKPEILPDGIWLEVHTKHSVKDASITTLSREKKEYVERRTLIGDSGPETILHHPWERVF